MSEFSGRRSSKLLIHAGAITTGSARTDSVVGLYWMISASSVRLTTTPLVKATVFPGSNALAASLRSLCNKREDRPNNGSRLS